MTELSLIVTLFIYKQPIHLSPSPPREDAGGLSREYVLRIRRVS